MSRAVLLTLGRLPKGLELARALHAAGCKVYVADPFGVHLSKPSRSVTKACKVTAPNEDQQQFLADILGLVERYGIDLIIPVSEEAVHVALLADLLPPSTELFCAPPAQMLQLHDKYAFIAAANKIGLPAPLTMRADDSAVEDFTRQNDYVLKPALGCSGAGLRLASHGEPLTAAERQASNIVQHRIHGDEVSTFSVARDGKVLGTCVYKGRIFAGTVATSFQRLTGVTDVEQWIKRFVAAQNYSGPIAFDFIVGAPGSAMPIECNPRLTSGIHFMQHADLAKAVLGAALPHPIRFKAAMTMQEGHTTLTKAYAALPNLKEFITRVGLVLSTRDVVWAWSDPLPFLLMTPMSWPVLKQVMFQGASFGEAATHDIEWHPDAQTIEAMRGLPEEGAAGPIPARAAG